jgi:8-oxo-dGTP pyrophosphatase MutT (NUDIX family)
MESKRRPIFRAGVVDLGVETATLPNGLTVELPIIRHPGAAAVVALDHSGRVAMLHQYRYAVGGAIWEIPAGCRAPEESGRRCAERELLEEAGVSAARWDYLGSLVTIPSICDERIELYLARDLSHSATSHEADEVIRVEWIELTRVLRMIREGEIIDAKTIAGIFQAQAFLAESKSSA